MKKQLSFIFCIVMLLGCSDTKIENTGSHAQYNQYLHTNLVALTDHNAVISDMSRLFYTDFDPLKEPDYLCYDPTCNHRDEDCSSYINGSMRTMIFGSQDYLYYTAMENESYGFYRMTYQGTEREKLFAFPYQENVAINADFVAPYVSAVVTTKQLNDGRGSILIRDISEDSGEWKRIFDRNEDRDYKSVFFHDGWFFAVYVIEGRKLGLEAYRLSDGKYADVTDDWDLLGASDIAVADDQFIWTKQEDGFYAKGFDEQEPEKIASLQAGIDCSQTFADDEFFYLVNTSKYIDETSSVPMDERGLKIFDRKGNLLMNFTVPELGFRPSYLWSEKDRIVFANTDSSFEFPYFYIYRDDIRRGKAEIHLISE